MVAHLLPKQRAAGSNPVSRSSLAHLALICWLTDLFGEPLF